MTAFAVRVAVLDLFGACIADSGDRDLEMKGLASERVVEIDDDLFLLDLVDAHDLRLAIRVGCGCQLCTNNEFDLGGQRALGNGLKTLGVGLAVGFFSFDGDHKKVILGLAHKALFKAGDDVAGADYEGEWSSTFAVAVQRFASVIGEGVPNSGDFAFLNRGHGSKLSRSGCGFESKMSARVRTWSSKVLFNYKRGSGSTGFELNLYVHVALSTHADRCPPTPSPISPMITSMITTTKLIATAGLLLTCAAGLALSSPKQDNGAQADEHQVLAATFRESGIEVDFDANAIAFPCKLIVTNDLLEYVLVGPNGSAHESLLMTDVEASMIHAALLTIGVNTGENAKYVAVDPVPTEEELKAGAKRFTMQLPSGDGIFIYLAWKEGEETYFIRVEDVINNFQSGRSMRRHRWTYIGSRFARLRAGEPEVYMADAEQNLINLAFFTEGNTLCTASLPECEIQTVWSANSWLLPPPGEDIRLVLSHERLACIPGTFARELPEPNRALDESAR